MRGRKPKPAARQIAEGDPRKHGVNKLQEKLDAEVQARRGLPPCPKHLSGKARSAWNFWAKELQLMNLDCLPDAMMLEGACSNYARAVEADDIVARDGLILEISTIDEDTGERHIQKTQANPAVAISNAAWRLVRAFCSEFGLSPVSRQRLTIETKEKEQDDLMKLLSQPREKRPITTVN